MSYDLILLSNNGAVSRQHVWDFFASRSHVEVNDHDIMYENPETGVHFQWIFVPYHQDEMNDATEPVHPDELGHLRLNFYRPTVFAEEAARELLALSEALPVAYLDLPQEQTYAAFTDPKQLTKPYEAHARDAFAALMNSEHGFEQPIQVPQQALRAIWKWNYDRDAFSDRLGEDLFVPKIDFYLVDGELKTGVAWGDGVPMFCPHVDVVLAVRQETSRRKGWLGGKKMQIDILHLEEFQRDFGQWFAPDPRAPRAVSCAAGDGPALQAALAGMDLRRQAAMPGKSDGHALQQLPFAAILDAELNVAGAGGTARLLTFPVESDSE